LQAAISVAEEKGHLVRAGLARHLGAGFQPPSNPA
jgi:hypothetical protein